MGLSRGVKDIDVEGIADGDSASAPLGIPAMLLLSGVAGVPTCHQHKKENDSK